MESKITTEMIKAFTGEGDVVAWIQKARLVAKLKKVTDLASFIPLFLDGDALALYLELSEDERSDAETIIAKLKEAFTDGAFVAYAKLVRMKWTGQPVDVYANEIRRLAGLAGLKGEGLESVVRLTFVNGLPDTISASLQQVDGVMGKPVSDIISVARVLCKTRAEEGHVAAVAKGVDGRRDGGAKGFKMRCFRCGGPHLIKYCEERVRCFKCQKAGHIASQCDQQAHEGSQDQGNE